MGEKLSLPFEKAKKPVASEKSKPLKDSFEKPKFEKFSYDSQKQEIFIYSKSKSGELKEKHHPFQEFLYALRGEGIKVSTSEWIDLQKVLAEGEVQSIDEFYIVSRAILVKDITDYPKFDTVFGRMFYNIEPPHPETDEEYEEAEIEEYEEREEVEEENLSQEIVEPGFTEEHHGGEDIHKIVEDTKSSRHEVEGKPLGRSEEIEEKKGHDWKTETKNEKTKERKRKKVKILEGKGGYSALERVIERRYDQYDKDQILNYEQFSRILSKLIKIVRESSEVPTGKLDVKATVKNIAENAGLPKLVWCEEIEKKPKVILLFDVGGSTDKFRPIMEKLFAAAKDCFDDVEVYYFHNAIYGEVWLQKDGNYGKNFIPLKEILKKDRDSRVIIVGDAWMAENELFDYFIDAHGRYFPSGIDSFKKLQETFPHVVWINPIKEVDHDKWDDSGTIAEIKKIFNMYDLTLTGLEKAIQKLIEE